MCHSGGVRVGQLAFGERRAINKNPFFLFGGPFDRQRQDQIQLIDQIFRLHMTEQSRIPAGSVLNDRPQKRAEPHC